MSTSIAKRPLLIMAVLFVTLSAPIRSRASVAQTSDVCWTFSETGKSLCGYLLDYWRMHGGLARLGFPLSEQVDVEPGSGKAIQYFERAVFMPRTSSTERDPVVLAPLAAQRFGQNYQPTSDNPLPALSYAEMPGDKLDFWQPWYPLSGAFLHYWQAHGGAGEFGYPISPLLREESELDDNLYTVQYFETAVFEYHPENTFPNDVLLSQLGTIAYKHTFWGPEDTLQGDWCGPGLSISEGMNLNFGSLGWGEFSEPAVLVFGRYDARGVFERPFGEYGRDYPGRMQEIRYVGKVAGSTLTLTITDGGGWRLAGPFTTTMGKCP